MVQTVKHLIVTGRVQGVGYRYFMSRAARELHITGWVRNRPDGTVEALIAGEVASVEELSRLCRRGPRMAEVRGVEEQEAPVQQLSSFRSE